MTLFARRDPLKDFWAGGFQHLCMVRSGVDLFLDVYPQPAQTCKQKFTYLDGHHAILIAMDEQDWGASD